MAVAARAGIPQTHLSTVANGKRPMGRDTASKLRPHVELDAAAWVELLAPMPEANEPTEAQA